MKYAQLFFFPLFFLYCVHHHKSLEKIVISSQNNTTFDWLFCRKSLNSIVFVVTAQGYIRQPLLVP